MADYLTLREFAQRRGMRTDRVAMQRLRRKLKARQKRLGRTFLFRFSDGENAPIFVTEPEMRQHCPELFDKRAEAIEMLREHVGHLDEAIAELKLRDRALAAKIRETRNMVVELSQCVNVRQSASLPSKG